MKRSHPDSDATPYRNHNETDILSGGSFEQLPDEVMFHIISFHSSPTLEGVAQLYQNLGRVSKLFRERVKGFVQTTPIECDILWKKKPYRMIAWLCDNHVKLRTLDATLDEWNHLDAGILLYIFEQCNLDDLVQVTVDFRHVDVTPPNYESFIATEAGIPGEVVDNIMNEEVMFRSNYRIHLQRNLLQLIGDRANKCFELNIDGFITGAGDACGFDFFTSQLVKLPLQKLHINLDHVYGSPMSQNDFDMLSDTIESLNDLESLSLHILGDCRIRSKSIRRLDYGGWNELIQCECPLLERMRLVVNQPGTAQLLSSFSHSIKKFCIFYRNNYRSPQDTDRLTEIIHGMPLLEEFKLEYRFFGTQRSNGCLDIKSESLRRINLESCDKMFQLSSCICPKLEVIECKFFDTITRCPLVPLDDGKFNDMISSWKKWRRTKVFSFCDCPFARCEVPHGCLIKLCR